MLQTILESILKLFSETNWKYQVISINYNNSFKVKISKWDVTYASLKHLKTSWIYRILCNVVPIFFCFTLILSSFFRASAYAIFAFSIILPTRILPWSTETEVNTSSDNSLAAPSSPLVTFSYSCKSCSLLQGILLHKYFLPLLFFWVIPLSFSLFFLLSLDSLCILLELTSVPFQVNNHFGFSLGI